MNTQISKNKHYTSKEALTITTQKKQECNTKALRIVEILLEENVTVEWLLENVKYIAQSHFQDAIEERAISKICGYPICSRRLGQIPRQQFHISTRTNKVYDITERKHFCSNHCYKAAQYLKGQLLTSPVWLRDQEIIPNFHLFQCDSPGEHIGEEVELRHDPIKIAKCDKISSQVEKPEASVFKFQYEKVETKGYTNSAVDTEKLSICTIQLESNPTDTTAEPSNIQAHDEDVEIKDDTNSHVGAEKASVGNIQKESKPELSAVEVKTTDDSFTDLKGTKQILDNNTGPTNEKKSQRNLKSSHKSKIGDKQMLNQVNFVSRIEKCLKAWFTLDSFLFIYGNERAKELMKDKKECLKEYYKGVEQTLWEPATQAKYLALCRKLNLMEMEEEAAENRKDETKPMPNFEQLKRDAEIMELKVREFYRGKSVDSLNANKSTPEKEEDSDCKIPLVELHAQNALRRRIVLDRLQYVLPDLLRTFRMNSKDITGDVRTLVTTFSLGADNIMFKPAEWNLIALIIIKMLSIKDPKLKTLMETQMAQQYTSMMLMGFQLDGGYLERLITWLADIDILLSKTYIKL